MELNHHRGGSGETLVLLHGIGSRWGMWEPVLAPLQERFDVIALDLPGFGDSPMPAPGTPPGPESLCSLVVESLAELGVERFHVAGDSLGGLMALELAGRARVRSACAISPAGFATSLETVAAKTALRVGRRFAQGSVGHVDALVARPGARRLLMSTFFAHPERQPPAAAAGDVRAFAAAPWFDATLPTIGGWRFPEIDSGVPVTIAWGTKDRVLFPRQADRARERIPAARVVRLPDCGHLPTWDDPGLVAGVIAAAVSGEPLPAGVLAT